MNSETKKSETINFLCKIVFFKVRRELKIEVKYKKAVIINTY